MGHFGLPHNRISFGLKMLLCLVINLVTLSTSAQILKTAWDKDYGGNIWEDCNSAAETSDGGYILGGYTSSTVTPFGDVSEPSLDGFFPPPDVGDYWIVKTDDQGELLWDRRYGSNKQDRLWSAQETPDGGYILGGVSNSDIGPQKSDLNRGYEDYWIIKTNALGDIEWDRSYGSDSIDYFYSLVQTSDGGYLLGGISRSDIGFEKSENSRGNYDMWIVKVDSLGNKLWDKTIGGAEEERLNEMQETPDGHYVIAGATASDADGADITQPSYGGKDYWLIKIDSADGGKIWEYRYGGTEEDEIQSFTQTQDGGFLLGGGSRSPVSAMKQEASQWVDFWIVKIDDLGAIQWEQTFGGPELDNCYSVKQNNIGNYLVAGYSASDVGPDKTEPNRGPVGTEDFWLIYLAPDGTKLWDKTLGGNNRDVLENIFQTTDGGYLLAGHSSSPASGDKQTDNRGLNDFWIIKTLCNVSVEFTDTTVCPNTPVVINATDTNCVQCTWKWEDGSIDSIRTINNPQSGSYAVTLVDGVGCSWTDDITVDLYTPPVLDLGSDLVFCEGQSAIIGSSLMGVDFDWSTGETSGSIVIDTTGNYRLIVTDANSCTARDSIDLLVHPLPEVDLGNDTSFCAGEPLFLDAGNTGASFDWFPVGTSQTLSVNPVSPLTFIVTVTDANNCSAVDSLQLLDVFTPPEVTGLMAECNALNTSYTVTFNVAGGDPATYSFSGNTGTFSNGIFVSDPIPKDQSFSIIIDDINGCGPVELNGSYDCGCITDAGGMIDDSITVCGAEEILVPHTGGQLDQDDLLEFVLHDGDAAMIGNVLLRQTSPIFQYEPTLIFGRTYYVVAIAGNNDNGTVNMQDGCLSFSNAIPITFYESPQAVIVADQGLQITCGNPNLPLSATSSLPFGGVDFAWSTVGAGNITTPLDAPQVEVNEAGNYQVIVTDQLSGCTAMESVVVDADDGVPNILIGVPAIYTCQDTLIALDASGSSYGSPYQVSWLGGNIDGYTDLDPVVNAPGEYILEIINQSNGCRVTDTVIVLADTLGSEVDAGELAVLDCVNSVVSLNGSYDCATCIFEWSTLDGNFIGGMNTLQPTVDLPGVYELTLFDAENGCTSIDEVTVIEDPDVPVGADLDISPPPCFGEDEGRIIIGNVNGGLAPYTYSLDGMNFYPSNEYYELNAGSYHLFIQDAKGCEWDSVLFLPDALPLVVDLGEEQTINLGDEILLSAIINRPVDSITWNGGAVVDCEGCLEQLVQPFRETLYTVTVIDDQGCQQSDFVLVRVRKDRNVFIPNAFSSDFNGFNDYFTIFADQSVKRIKSLRIFSRWGEVVFEKFDFQPNIETEGWNGTMNGKDLDPGVYIYSAVIEFIDGEEEVFKGDILLAK